VISTASVATRSVPFLDLPAQYEEEREELLPVIERVLRSGHFVGGDDIDLLEAELAEGLGAEHVIALNSGTDALILGLLALGIGPGDEVITPSNSFVASSAAIAHVGAVPVFADVLDDQMIDPDAVAAAITSRTKAIMPVHLTGRIADMGRIGEIATRNSLAVIEDAAQAFGSRFGSGAAGTFGDVGCFSTHPLKNLNAAGDGGFVVVRDRAVADKVRKLRNHGFVDRDTSVQFGFVSRMDTLQAAILRVRLRRVDGVVERRRRNARIYDELLDREHIFVPPSPPELYHTYHLYVIQVDVRDELQRSLAAKSIGTKIHYPVPIHLQPAAAALRYRVGSLPATERQADRILSVPINQFLSEDDVAYVCAAINAYCKRK
jgi:dTDP-4-amino-4,6-dideoxygalactose transaminase